MLAFYIISPMLLSHWIQWKAKLLLLLPNLVILLHLIFWSSSTFNTYQLSMNLSYGNYQLSVFFFIVVNAKNVTICWVLAPYMLFPWENVACRALEGILTWMTLKCTTFCWSPQNLVSTIREGERWSFPTSDLQFTIFQWRANHYLTHQVWFFGVPNSS